MIGVLDYRFNNLHSLMAQITVVVVNVVIVVVVVTISVLHFV